MTIDEAAKKLEKAFPNTWIDISICRAIKPILANTNHDYWNILIGGNSFTSEKSLDDCVCQALRYRLLEL